MAEDNCIFCKIARGVIPSTTVYEDEDFRVILDLGPASKGHSLILPKKHFANVCELDKETAAKVLPLGAKIGAAMKKGDKLPDFHLKSAVYGDISSTELKGKVVLVSLFATWCGPCQLELAEIEKTLWAEYKDNKDFVLLVIGREHTDEQLKAYNERKKFTFPLYPDPKREVFSLFAEKSIPRAYLFNKEGEAVYTSIGYEKEEFGYLMNAIAEALK